MKGNRTNHPPRTTPVKPKKGGRTQRYSFAMTPATFERIKAIVKEQGVSMNDWLECQIKHSA